MEEVGLACCIRREDVPAMSCCSCIGILLGVGATGSLVRARNLVMRTAFVVVVTVLTLETRCWNIVRRLNAVCYFECFELQELLLLQRPPPQRFRCGDFDGESEWYGG